MTRARDATHTHEEHAQVNEVVVHAQSVGSTAELDLIIDDENVTSYRGDGLIIST